MSSTILPTTVNVSTMQISNVTEEHHKIDFSPYISIIVFSILTIMFNFLVIFILSYYPKLRRRNSNKFLLNLMISNLCVGFVMLCFGTFVIVSNYGEHTFANHTKPPIAISLMFGVLILLSVMNMILLSGDRLYTVKWTFRYFDSVKSRQVYIAIILPWIISVIYLITLITLLQLGNENIQDIVQHVIYISFDTIAFLGFLTLAVTCSVIYKVARVQLVRISRTSVTDTINFKQRKKKLKFREIRLALINIGLITKFIILWLPTMATMTYHLVWEEATSEFLEHLAFHLVLLNCLCDSTVYVFLSKDIRGSIKSLSCKKQNNDISPAITERIIGVACVTTKYIIT